MFVLPFIIATLVCLCTYNLYKSYILKKKLKWVEMASGWPLVGNAFDFRDSTKSFNNMHKYVQKHNGLCYIELLGRPLILISDYKFLEWLLPSTTILTKSKDYASLASWLEEGILITHGPTWKKGRKIITPTFHFSILDQFVEVFEKSALVLINILNKEVGKDATDIYPFMNLYGLDVICDTSMGVQMNVQENSNREYVDAVAGMCKIVEERAFNPIKMIDFFYYLSFDYIFKERKYVKLLHSVSNAVIKKRKEEIQTQNKEENVSDIGAKKKMAFLDLLLTYKDYETGLPLSDKFIREQVDTFMFAGHDTTTSANSFALYCLATHLEVQDKALQEIKEILGDREVITHRDLQEMKYLELVIKESLRLYPSVPLYSRQTTEDTIYKDNRVIPKGVTLIVVAYSINRNPEVFEDPEKFIPERFLNKDIKPYSYVPFSAGPRNCIGQKFAMLNMKFTLAKMLLNFQLLPVPDYTPILAAETVLKSKNGIYIKLKKREKSD